MYSIVNSMLPPVIPERISSPYGKVARVGPSPDASSNTYFRDQMSTPMPTGLRIKIDTPIVNTQNVPIIALKADPICPLLDTFVRNKDAGYSPEGGNFWIWDRMRSVIIPMACQDLAFDDAGPLPDGVTIEEYDDPNMVTLLNFHLGLWKGSFKYLLRPQTNVTTQGYIAFSRTFDTNRPLIWKNPAAFRTPLEYPVNSQLARALNSQSIYNPSETSDLILDVPFIEKVPFQSRWFQNLMMSNAGDDHNGIPKDVNSWYFLDILGQLASSQSSLYMTVYTFVDPDFEIRSPWPIGMRWLNDKLTNQLSGLVTKIAKTPTVNITGYDTYVQTLRDTKDDPARKRQTLGTPIPSAIEH